MERGARLSGAANPACHGLGVPASHAACAGCRACTRGPPGGREVKPGAPVLLSVAVIGAVIVGLQSGATWLAPSDVIAALADPMAPGAAIVRGLRLPRVLLAFLVGGSL